MKDRTQKALENQKKGYNCCQAVACAYSDQLGVDEATMFRVAEGFGAGMGGFECTCGAVAGAVIVAGMKNSSGDVKDHTKESTRRAAKQITEAFKEKNGSMVCRELKGMNGGKILRSCNGCIEDAAKIVAEVL